MGFARPDPLTTITHRICEALGNNDMLRTISLSRCGIRQGVAQSLTTQDLQLQNHWKDIVESYDLVLNSYLTETGTSAQ